MGLALTALVVLAYVVGWAPMVSLEWKTYDMRARMMKSRPASPVVIVAIDDRSITEIGRWPWPRSNMAAFIDKMTDAGAKVIGVDVLYTEPSADPGLKELGALRELVQAINDKKLAPLVQAIDTAQGRLDNDGKFEESITKSGRVVLPLYFTMGERLDNTKPAFEPFASKNSIKGREAASEPQAQTAVLMAAPLFEFADAAMGLGHDNLISETDGSIRRAAMLVDYGGRLFPSFALASVMRSLGFEVSALSAEGGIRFGRIDIPTNPKFEVFIRYLGPAQSFQYFSFADVINGKAPEGAFKDKIVLVGLTGTGLSTSYVTPMGHDFPAVEIEATQIDNILNRNYIARPSWARWAELVSLIVFGLILSLVVPRLRAIAGAALAAGLLIAWDAAAVYMFTSNGLWINMFPHTLLIGLAYTVLVSKKFAVTERGKEKVEAASIETNKMLGLSFQGQGLLDLALDKFMNCPIEDESIREHMYNLALDFERKRMFNKAVSVYEHIKKAGPYRDIDDKIAKLTKVGDTMIFGSSPLGGGKKDSTLVVEGVQTAATLGRYEVQRELGRGAMGTVYLGKDPKINRMVAIKTIRFEEVDPSVIKDVKERFFREAEAAGKLSHPNIVTIYDAGEDYDLAYVAMELLDGMDLSDYIHKLGDKRVAVRTAIQIVGQIASALDYAHKNGVVHRDIKPANIMLMKKGGVKVTDFGIARVMESSKTQTGVVLGTPSYMSPEQVVGRKVDGRSDIFSLGVMFYELLSGRKPFTGDSVATLMYAIANAPHEPLGADVPPCCAAIANRMIEKDLSLRYQSGAEAARDLMACMKSLGAA